MFAKIASMKQGNRTLLLFLISFNDRCQHNTSDTLLIYKRIIGHLILTSTRVLIQ